MEEFLRNLISNGWFQLYFVIGNAVTIWVGLTLGNKISNYFHLPYFFYKAVNKNEFGYSLEIISSIVKIYGVNSDLIKQLDRSFYRLHGIYKRYGITSGVKNSIGTPFEFVNGARFQASCLDQSILICFNGVRNKDVYHKIEQIIRFYTKQLRGEVSTDLLRAISISILSQLGADLPKSWKEPSYRYLKILFLSSLLEDGSLTKASLSNLAVAESLMIQYGNKFKQIRILQKRLEAHLNNGERRSLDYGPVQDFVFQYNKVWQELAEISQGD